MSFSEHSSVCPELEKSSRRSEAILDRWIQVFSLFPRHFEGFSRPKDELRGEGSPPLPGYATDSTTANRDRYVTESNSFRLAGAAMRLSDCNLANPKIHSPIGDVVWSQRKSLSDN